MAEELYTYAVARIRSKEMTLFTKQTIDQLMSCKTYEDCLKSLYDRGWGSQGDTAEQLLKKEREKLWELMKELVEDTSVFDVFLYANDFHNLKAAIKQACVSNVVENRYMTAGTVDIKTIETAIKEKDFSLLPESMRACAEEAYEVQLKTQDSQLTDVIIDRAALEAIYKKGMESGKELFEGYAELKVAAANINIAVRSCKTGKGIEFLQKAFVPCGKLNVKELTEAVLMGLDAVYAYLETTAYADAISAIKESPSAFERWCDNRIIEHIRPERYNPFTISPLAAYILARENEIKSVRILLSGKQNDLPEESIRERLREMYV